MSALSNGFLTGYKTNGSNALMNGDYALQDFAQQFHTQVLERSRGAEARTPMFKENAFVEITANYLDDFGVTAGLNVCYFSRPTERGLLKANAYSIDEDSCKAEILVALYCDGKPRAITNAEIMNARSQAVNFLDFVASSEHKHMEDALEPYEMAQRFFETRDAVKDVTVYLVTDGLAQIDELANAVCGPWTVRFDVWDIGRLFRHLTSPVPYESSTIDFLREYNLVLQCLPGDESILGYPAYLTYIPGEVVFGLYEKYGQSLLDLNVRSFLQFKGKTNRGIRETILSEPARFLAYNNGICATAEEVKTLSHNGSTAISAIKGLQIVNGGQTVVAVHRARKLEAADISRILVQAKITVVSPEEIPELAPLISRYSNTQNRVTEADFSANDAYHREIERLSRQVWVPGEQSRWFYERSRGQYQVERMRAEDKDRFDRLFPTNQVINKTDLAIYLNSWNGYPNIVSLHAQKNFISFMIRLHKDMTKDWKPDADYYRDAVAKAILFRRVKGMLDENRAEIPAYRPQVAAYVVAYLAYRTVGRVDFVSIWDNQRVSDGVEMAACAWCKDIYETIVGSAENRDIGEWCKNEDCWTAIKALRLLIPSQLSKELARVPLVPSVGPVDAQREASGDPEAQENIARVMSIAAATWTQIAETGRTTGEQNEYMGSIAMTLAGYAALGWNRIPSAKQARCGVELLNWFEQLEGAISPEMEGV